MAHFGPTLRRSRRRDRPGWRTLLAVALSVVLNLFIITHLDASFLGLGEVKPVRSVDLAPLAATDWEANRSIRDPGALPPPPAPRLAPRPPEPPPHDPRKMPGQVVETATANGAVPKETRYVSDRDNSVDKETRSRFRGPGAPAGPPGPVGAGTAASKAQGGKQGQTESAAEGRAGQRGGPAERVARADRPTEQPKVVEGGLLPAPTATPQAARSAQPAGEEGQRLTGQYDPRLAITPQIMARLGGGGSPDKLDNVEDGDGTFLNTREWKYATYFNRIKQAVASSWDPHRALDARDPDRSMFAYKDRFTLLSVTLDDAGGVKDLQVKKTSGVDFLDRTALDAFRKAQPFNNPPKGIIDAQGEIRFTFGFYLEVGQPGFRLYRSASPP